MNSQKVTKKLMNDPEIPIYSLKSISRIEEDIKLKKKEADHLSFSIKVLDEYQKDDEKHEEKSLDASAKA